MKNYFYYSCWCLLVILTGCWNGNDGWQEETILDLDDKPSIEMEAEVIPVSYGFLDVKDFYVLDDNTLIVVNKGRKDCPNVILADLTTGEILASTLFYGNGPNEALLVQSYMKDGILFIDDFAKSRLYRIDPRELLTAGSDYSPSMILDYSDLYTPFIIPLDSGGTFLVMNPYCFEDKTSGIKNDEVNRFFFYSSGDNVSKEFGPFKYDPYNVNQGYIIPSSENDRIVFIHSSLPAIEVYDSKGRKIRHIQGPSLLPARYAVNEDGGIAFSKDGIPYAYRSFFCSGNDLYVNYVGDYLKDYSSMKSTIIRMDFDGHALMSFTCPVFVSAFSVMDDGTIYGKGYDQDDTPVLWRLRPAQE